MWGNYSWAYLLQESCMTKRKWIESKGTQKKSKSWSYPPISSFSWSSFEFIIFSFFWCFWWFRKLPMHSNWCFFMPWRSRNHPRLILDRFGKSHFFMKFFKILTHMSEPTSTKTHMYIHNLVNLRVPRPQATQNAKTKWNLSNSTEQMLRKTKNKIEKCSKSGDEDISKIQHPR